MLTSFDSQYCSIFFTFLARCRKVYIFLLLISISRISSHSTESAIFFRSCIDFDLRSLGLSVRALSLQLSMLLITHCRHLQLLLLLLYLSFFLFLFSPHGSTFDMVIDYSVVHKAFWLAFGPAVLSLTCGWHW